MTALVPLTTRLRMARVAVVVPPEFAGPEAADLAAHGADLLVLSKGNRSVEEAVESIQVARKRLFSLPTLVAADDLEVAAQACADVVFLKRPGWRPFGYRRPHEYSLFGRSIDGASDLDKIDGDPFVFGFVGPAVTDSGVNDEIARTAAAAPPVGLPAAPVWFAAGGISSVSVHDVLAAGARRVTVSTSIFRSADPNAETRAIADAVKAAWDADPGAQAYSSDAFAG